MGAEGRNRAYPELAEFAAHVAALRGLTTVVDVGFSWTPEMAVTHPELTVVGAGLGDTRGRLPSGIAFSRRVDLGSPAGLRSLERIESERSLVVLSGALAALPNGHGAQAAIEELVKKAPLAVVATATPEPIVALLSAAGLRPSFVGRTRADERDEERKATLIVLDRSLRDVGAAPESFRVVAIMTTYNEEDVIEPSIGKLIAGGIGVYLIDNWSSDRTFEIAEQFLGRGLVGLERFPDAPIDRYEWRSLLRRVDAVAAGLDADWCIHHDADEVRSGPWSGVGLRDALWRVDQAGFSAVDHTVVNFRPIDNGYKPSSDFEAYFRRFEFGRTSDLLLQIKAWKNVGPVDLESSGGHEAKFGERLVFPYKFELKHYPIRSQSHGERKVFRDRIARWDPGERALGWHVHYDDVAPQQSFLRAADDLIEDWGADTQARFLPELLAGAGLAETSFPRWALRSPAGRRVYVSGRRFARSRAYARLRGFPLFRIGFVRTTLRRVRARLAS